MAEGLGTRASARESSRNWPNFWSRIPREIFCSFFRDFSRDPSRILGNSREFLEDLDSFPSRDLKFSNSRFSISRKVEYLEKSETLLVTSCYVIESGKNPVQFLISTTLLNWRYSKWKFFLPFSSCKHCKYLLLVIVNNNKRFLGRHWLLRLIFPAVPVSITPKEMIYNRGLSA